MSQTFNFAGRRVLVAGGSRGIGRGIAAGFASAGASVSICARGADTLEATRTELAAHGVTAHASVCDLGDAKAIVNWVESAAKALGGIDVLVNNSSAFGLGDTEEGWEASLGVDVQAVVRASRAALPHLKASAEGRIIKVGANAALKSAAGMGAYAASKAGVHRLTESLAEELKDTSVTVNAVLPSILDTAQNRKDMPDADPARWVAPADLARVMLFLASAESRAITGALIPVTGRV